MRQIKFSFQATLTNLQNIQAALQDHMAKNILLGAKFLTNL